MVKIVEDITALPNKVTVTGTIAIQYQYAFALNRYVHVGLSLSTLGNGHGNRNVCIPHYMIRDFFTIGSTDDPKNYWCNTAGSFSTNCIISASNSVRYIM